MSSQRAGGAEAPVGRAAAHGGSQWANGSSAWGSIGNEYAGVCTYQPRATRRTSAANAARRAGRDVLDDARAIGEVERAVVEGQAHVASASTNGPGYAGRATTSTPVMSSSGSSARRPSAPQPTSTTRMPGRTPVRAKKRAWRRARARAASGEARRPRRRPRALA